MNKISLEKVCSLKDLRIADLELFISAAYFQSLGKAASLHHLSQSAASTAIMRVEAALGLSLCEHERRRFQLTEEGKNVLPRLEAWVRDLSETVINQDPIPLRLAMTHAIARVSIPAVWSLGQFTLKLMRPDKSYAAVLRDEADVALVLDNALWEGVTSVEVGKGCFQLYATERGLMPVPVLLPEDQIEVLALQQRWEQMYGKSLPIKARLPSWSLIADLCGTSSEVGFLPDFLGQQTGLYPVSWQPVPSHYRILALYRRTSEPFLQRLAPLLSAWKRLFVSL